MLELLSMFGVFLVLLLISIPLHELGHFAVLKAFGCKNKLRIKFSSIIIEVDGSSILHFPGKYRRAGRLIALLSLIAGGCGSALILSSGFLFFPVRFWQIWFGPLLGVILLQLGDAIFETKTRLRNIKITF